MDYNTSRNHLMLREYGRHIQRMVEHVMTMEEDEKRQKNALAIVETMGILNPQLKNVEDYKQKFWDHLYEISDYTLDVKSPYPVPTREEAKARPKPLPYPKRYPRYTHLGKNLEMVIQKALEAQDADKKQGFANAIAYYMKLAYNNWHKELVADDVIQSEMNALTDGQLTFTNTPYVKAYRMQPEGRSGGGYGKRGKFQQRGGGGGGRRDMRGGFKKKRY